MPEINTFDDHLMQQWIGRAAKKDDKTQQGRFPFYMGIELELENPRYGRDLQINPAWTTHNDESLRNGIEFVLAQPMCGDKLLRAVDAFYDMDLKYTGGPRTSTHIHVNVGDSTVRQVRTMFVLSYILEDAVFRIIEAKRKWCGYCMPLSEMNPHRLRNFLSTTSMDEFSRAMGGHNAEKYYGFNINSVRKHGTVEFRYFPGAPSKEELVDWMDYCTAIKRAGLLTSVEALAALQDPESLGNLIAASLGRWGMRAVNAVGAQTLFNSLMEVLSYLPEADGVSRRDELVFISDPLTKLISQHFCRTPYQRDWLIPRLQKLEVMSLGEWENLLDQSGLYIAKAPPAKAMDGLVRLDEAEVNMPARPRYAGAVAGPELDVLQAQVNVWMDEIPPVPVEAGVNLNYADALNRIERHAEAMRQEAAARRAAVPRPAIRPRVR